MLTCQLIIRHDAAARQLNAPLSDGMASNAERAAWSVIGAGDRRACLPRCCWPRAASTSRSSSAPQRPAARCARSKRAARRSTPARPSSPCAGSSTSSSPTPAPTSRGSRSRCIRVETLARHAWSDERAARSLRRSGAQRRRHRRLRRQAEAEGYRALLRRARAASTRRCATPSSARSGRARSVSCAAPASRGLADLTAHLALHDPVGRARRIFPRSAAAPTVRPLRDLLRLLAVPRAGDADAGRACRAGRRLAGRRRHAPARAALADLAARRAARVFATARGAERILVERRPRHGRRAGDGERIERRRRRVQRRCRARCAPGFSARRRSPALHSAPPAQPLAVGRDLGDARRRRRAFRCVASQCVLLARLPRRVRRHLPRRRLPREPTVYVCAQDRGDETTRRSRATERCSASSTRPPTGDTRPFDPRRCANARRRTFRLLAHCGLRHRARRRRRSRARRPADFDAAVPGDGRRALRPGVARLDGVVHAAGSAHAGSRASIWRGAACIRGRACRWRRCRAGWRRRALMADLASTRPVAPGGYRWWYVDALSDDGQHGLTVIAFIGSVFSPYYAWSRRGARSANHCARQCRALRPARRALGDDRARPQQLCRRTQRRSVDRPELAAMARRRADDPPRRDRGAVAQPHARRDSSSSPWRSNAQDSRWSQGQSSLAADRARGARGGGSSTRRSCAGEATAISTPTPATSRSKRPLLSGPGRAPISATARQCSTTPSGAAKRRCRSPCASSRIGRAGDA